MIASSREKNARRLNVSRWVAMALSLPITFGTMQVRAESVEAIVSRGLELRRKAKDAEALAEFKKAWAIEKTPRIEAQIALAEQALGLWVVAEEDLLDALTKKDDPWTRKNRAKLTGALAVIQSHLGTLDIWGTPAGAAIFVNEKSVGTLPLKNALRVSDESVVLRARGEGYLDWTRTVRVEPGQAVRQHVEMVPQPPVAALDPTPATTKNANPQRGEAIRVDPAPSSSEAKTDPPVEATAQAESRVQPAQRDAGDRPSNALRPYAWAAGGGALLGLGLGVVESIVARNKRIQFNGMPECGTNDPTAGCKILVDDYNQAIKLATVGFAVGGGLAVVLAALFLFSSGGDQQPTRVARACVTGLRGVSCILRF